MPGGLGDQQTGAEAIPTPVIEEFVATPEKPKPAVEVDSGVKHSSRVGISLSPMKKRRSHSRPSVSDDNRSSLKEEAKAASDAGGFELGSNRDKVGDEQNVSMDDVTVDSNHDDMGRHRLGRPLS